jgi:S1-C subfamily serine protease
MSYKSDLALLKLDDKETVFVPATVASKDITLEFGQDIWSVSYPLGFSKTLTVGALGYVENIPSLSSLSSSSEYYRSTPDVAPGSSGSALFAKEAGKFVVIGTLTAQFNGFPFVNLYTPIEEIQEYLDTAKRSYEVNTEEQTTLKGKN